MQLDLFFPQEVHRQVVDGTLPAERIAEALEMMKEAFGRPIRGEAEAVAFSCLLLELIEMNWPRGSLDYAMGQWARACAPLVVHSVTQKTKPDGETSGSGGSV